ncbi:restriction endonuclease [Streptomyces collinus]|uniref:restriction endonuclease n=1 Tax=Streptomyces collinus TaxID=42684 RepID=UPI0029432B3D|nr:restriction endonuclease [Streptomyces collinus]
MTVPTRPLHPVPRRRRFDLRTTTWFFVLLALLLSLGGLIARTAAQAAQRRPVWAVILLLLASAAVIAGHRGRRRWSARRALRRATEALEAAAETAADALQAPAVAAVPVEVADPLLPPAPAAVPAEETLLLDAAVVPQVMDYAVLDPEEFEQAIAELCTRDGCTDVEVVGGVGDLGADVLAVAPSGHRLVVQCKRYGEGNRVGSQDLQRFGGTCFTVHQADIAVLVTTADFTAPALEYAEQCGIVCMDAEALTAWHLGTGPRPWETPCEG